MLKEGMMRYLLMVAMFVGAAWAYAGDREEQHNGRSGEGRGGPPKVYDAQGKYVGQLETNSGTDGVFLTLNGVVTFAGIARLSVTTPAGIILSVSATQFQWASKNSINYQSADCSGAPFMDWLVQLAPYALGPRPSVAVRLGTDVVLYVAGEADSTTISARSYRQSPNSSACQTLSVPIEHDLSFLSERSYPLTQMYPEPLTIRY
jgi:hypothetical protein